FGVMNKVQRAAQLTKAFRITGTPTIIVNGKYITGPSYAMEDNGVNYPRMTAVMDDLINMERKKK
ncbi:MAG: thiol:disulfide interchange protein, partial [Burkholderiales bacterium]|nr:thiol:disulfide interchange protein [Burkholderiales bacterium]